jgi:peroxiredoxin
VRKRPRLRTGALVAIVVGVAVLALGAIFFLNNRGGSSAGAGQAGQYAFQVGSPGVGEMAPAIQLASTTGGTFDLASQRGKTVLLYFQEGLTCQPCWDQLKDIQSNISQFKALGIDTIVSITTDPLDALRQKVSDEGLTIPVLSDPLLMVSQAYTANGYGMMGTSRDGHTFIVVGPDGRIRWRADYGGSPNYTMYVPISNLVADIRAGLKGGSS